MRTGIDTVEKRKRLKCIIGWTIVMQTLIIVVLLVLLLGVGVSTPKVRLGSISVENLNVSSSNSSSFSLKLNTRVTVKNTNFGRYKFDETKVAVSYRGTEVGEATIFKAHAKARSTKKFNVIMSLDSNNVLSNPHLGSDVDSKNLTFNAHANLKGKVYLLEVFNKKRTAEMNCTFVVNASSKMVNNLSCK